VLEACLAEVGTAQQSLCTTVTRRPSGISALEPSTPPEASGTALPGKPSSAFVWRTRSRDRNDAVTAYSQAREMDVATLEILVLRAWLESGGKPRLRVRLVAVIPGQAERQVLSTTSVEDACEAVRNWLTALEPERGPSAP